MSELQDRLSAFLTAGDLASRDIRVSVIEELFLSRHAALADAIFEGTQPAYRDLMAAVAMGDHFAVRKVLTDMTMAALANGYAFREWELEEVIRTEQVR